MPKQIIVVDDLVKRYKGSKKNAVDHVSFSVKKGEFFALLGPNGAGKTTIISILTTTLSKTSGKVVMAGYDLDQEASKIRREVGIIFQAPSLDRNLTAEENIRFHAVLYGLYSFRPAFRLMPKEYRDSVNTLTDVLGIRDSLNKAVGTFSGGMKRKLEIVRSLMHEPKILVLDEPTTGLDPVSRKNLWEYLGDVRQKNDMTIFLTTHYLEEAEDADTVCVINEGKVLMKGTPTSLKKKLTQETLIVSTQHGTSLKRELEKHKLYYKKIGGTFRVDITKHNNQKVIQQIKTPLNRLEIHSPSLEEAYFQIIGKEESGKL